MLLETVTPPGAEGSGLWPATTTCCTVQPSTLRGSREFQNAPPLIGSFSVGTTPGICISAYYPAQAKALPWMESARCCWKRLLRPGRGERIVAGNRTTPCRPSYCLFTPKCFIAPAASTIRSVISPANLY